jgi:hypothetical protein
MRACAKKGILLFKPVWACNPNVLPVLTAIMFYLSYKNREALHAYPPPRTWWNFYKKIYKSEYCLSFLKINPFFYRAWQYTFTKPIIH